MAAAGLRRFGSGRLLICRPPEPNPSSPPPYPRSPQQLLLLLLYQKSPLSAAPMPRLLPPFLARSVISLSEMEPLCVRQAHFYLLI